MKHKFYMTANLHYVEETEQLRKEVASVIPLPDVNERQPDLSYFTSRFVSSGTNLNYAHFMGSELVKARKTVVAKAVDVEHNENDIIGHIYTCEFTDKEGKKLNIDELSSQEISKLDAQDMHIEIASVVYKTRFPELAKEIKSGEWKVSMEAYYTSYDVLVGGTVLSAEEAQLMGFDVANDKLYGKAAKIVKAGEIIDQGIVAKVLRGICFSGVGIVKSPANKPSIIFEATAGIDDITETIEFNLDTLNVPNNVTCSSIETFNNSISASDDAEGLCVHYKKEETDSLIKDQDTKVLNTEWCSKYSKSCPVEGNFSNSACLDKVNSTVADELDEVTANKIKKIVSNKLSKLQKDREIQKLIETINSFLD